MATDDQIEQRVRQAVIAAAEGLERPDLGRLAVIERRLLARSRGRYATTWRWWLVLFGIAAGSAAAFWAVTDEGLFGRDASVPEVPAPAEPGGSRAESARGQAGDAEDGGEGRDSGPVIYIAP